MSGRYRPHMSPPKFASPLSLGDVVIISYEYPLINLDVAHLLHKFFRCGLRRFCMNTSTADRRTLSLGLLLVLAAPFELIDVRRPR